MKHLLFLALFCAAALALTTNSPVQLREGGFNAVITGGSRGVGYAMAKEFLKNGDRVVICGRDQNRLAKAVKRLQEKYAKEPEAVHGIATDITSYDDVERLGKFAKEMLGEIDFWVNNAGSVAYKRRPILELEPDDLKRVVDTNLLGTMYCCKVAIDMMKEQSKVGHIFVMDGAGVDGGQTSGYAAYGATKRAMPQLSGSLNAELKNLKLDKKIGVHNLSPGMVLTDLLLSDSTPVIRKFFNVLAEEPETVASYLVPKIREVEGSGKYIRFLSNTDGILRILKGFPQIIFGGRFFDFQGNRVTQPGATYNEVGVRVDTD
jgi:chlorophyll(ide) b reductase